MNTAAFQRSPSVASSNANDNGNGNEDNTLEEAAILFTQPVESHLGDCPVCFLPLNRRNLVMHTCCCKTICNGCAYSYYKSNSNTAQPISCLFCRIPPCKSEEEAKQQLKMRANSKDPVAMNTLGALHFLKNEYDDAFRYWKQGAEVGDAESHFNMGVRYRSGDGIEKDEEMGLRHLEKAAIAGHPLARSLLGCYEDDNHRYERASKHFFIAASFGCCQSVLMLTYYYQDGYISEDEYAGSLRAYQAFEDASTSKDRKEAEDDLEWKERHLTYNEGETSYVYY